MSAKNSSIFIFLFLALAGNAYSNVVTYSGQKNDAGLKSDKFLVTVSQNNKPFESFTYISKAGNDKARELYGQQGKTFSYTTFSFSQAVIIEVTKIGSSAKSAVLRPSRLGLGTVTTENVLYKS